MKNLISILFILVLLSACKLFNKKDNDIAVAKYGKNYLYASDILGKDYTQEDLNTINEAQINNWLAQQAWYNEAKSNLKNEKDINKELEKIKRSLYANYYKEQFLNEQNINPSDEEITAYYKENKDLFVLKDNKYKIEMYIMPSDFNNLNAIKSELDQDLKNKTLEEYCQSNPSNCIQTAEWTTENDLDALGVPDYMKKTAIKFESFVTDNNQEILLRIIDKRSSGTLMSLELASNRIREILYHQKAAEMLSTKEAELLTKAQKDNDFKILK